MLDDDSDQTAQADLNLRRVHMAEGRFSHVAGHILYLCLSIV